MSSKFQSKLWRSNQTWWKGGKHNECQSYQKCQIIKITGMDLIGCNGFRINGTKFNYTHNIKNYQLFYNVKMVCGTGGSQIRTLKLQYDFICKQGEYLLSNKDRYFINILDGDASYKSMKDFNLLEKEKYRDICKYMFVGDMYLFERWFKNEF